MFSFTIVLRKNMKTALFSILVHDMMTYIQRYDDSFIDRSVKAIGRDHWLGAYTTNALYSGHIFVRFNDLEDVFT